MSDRTQKRFTRKEWSWILYDWANSVYATNIMAAIFPAIFVAYAGNGGDYWWGIGTSLSTLIIAIMAPFLGAIADYKGMKKKLFTAFVLIGVVFTALIALTGDWRVMLIGYVVSHIGFSGANLFYDSFLTDVTSNDRMDKVSSWGYAMGYIGGSTIPFVISIALLITLGNQNVIAQKFSILITSAWWLLFTIPMLKNVNQEHYIEKTGRLSGKDILGNISHTLKDIVKRRGLFLFMLAYFFYIDGVGTVISISTAYGASLGLGMTGMILALLVTQIVAMPCSILFGRLAQKISTRKALLMAILVYTFICCMGFVMGFTLEPKQESYQQSYATHSEQTKTDFAAQFKFEDETGASGALDSYLNKASNAVINDKEGLKLPAFALAQASKKDQSLISEAQTWLQDRTQAYASASKAEVSAYQKAIGFSLSLFWVMAIMVGTVQGGIQAVSRSYFSKLVPKNRSNEYFGFFDIFGKFATVIGPFLYAVVGQTTGRSSFGTLCLASLFLVGFAILYFAKKPLEELEKERIESGEGN